MSHLRYLFELRVLCATLAIASLADCSGNSATAPKPPLQLSGSHVVIGQPKAADFSCPASGTTEYVSDYFQNVIEVFHGSFHNQAPCGQITSGLSLPYGLYVDASTHDLYVANTGAGNVLVFHKGQTTPYNTYVDPTPQTYPDDVTVAGDGTVLASNEGAKIGEGSISTWIGGPNGGTFVGNFPMMNAVDSGFIAVRNGLKVYYNDQDAGTGHGAIWSMSCPAGACGPQTQVKAVFKEPGGMVFNSAGHLLLQDPTARRADIFDLPNPKPKQFKTLIGSSPDGLAIDERQHHWFVGDWNSEASEYSYPSGNYIGSVHGPKDGNLRAIAVDP